jgi:hypothetical protein
VTKRNEQLSHKNVGKKHFMYIAKQRNQSKRVIECMISITEHSEKCEYYRDSREIYGA